MFCADLDLFHRSAGTETEFQEKRHALRQLGRTDWYCANGQTDLAVALAFAALACRAEDGGALGAGEVRFVSDMASDAKMWGKINALLL